MATVCASQTRAFGVAKASRPAARRSVVVRAADAPTVPKSAKGAMTDSMGYELMRPGVKVRGGALQPPRPSALGWHVAQSPPPAPSRRRWPPRSPS